MNRFSMIIVIGIAFILSIPLIFAINYPKVLPDNAPYLNNSKNDTCSFAVRWWGYCGWVVPENDTIGFIRLACLCPSGQQCEIDTSKKSDSDNPDSRIYTCKSAS